MIGNLLYFCVHSHLNLLSLIRLKDWSKSTGGGGGGGPEHFEMWWLENT